ncbi:MAG: hypothetical protein KAS11_06090 [Candidatus Aenigmarchaeota archaeon]|nr:hypothetical protein [Candidatus Aenigmarchaeota archaeon]
MPDNDSFKDLKTGDIIYFSSETFNLEKDFYFVGTVICDGLPNRLENALIIRFNEMLLKTYNSIIDEMQKNEEYDDYAFVYPDGHFIFNKDSFPELNEELKIISIKAPLPYNKELAQMYTDTLENNLRR